MQILGNGFTFICQNEKKHLLPDGEATVFTVYRRYLNFDMCVSFSFVNYCSYRSTFRAVMALWDVL